VRAPSWTYREVRFPHELEAPACLRLLVGLNAVVYGPLLIETIANSEAVRFGVGVQPRDRAALDGQLRGSLPGVRLVTSDDETRPVRQFRRALALRLSSHRRPLLLGQPETSSAALLAVLGGLGKNETVGVQWILGPRLRAIAIPNRFEDFTHESWWQTVLAAPLAAPGPVDPAFRRALAAKQGTAGWRALGRIAVRASTTRREYQLLSQVIGALRSAEGPGLKLLAKHTPPARFELASLPLWRWPLVLNAEEALSLLGWPVGVAGTVTSRLVGAGHRPLVASMAVPRTGRVLLDGTAHGGERQLCLNGRDARQHLLVLGPTGVGKSTLLLNLILQDLEAGRGLVVIDPKGDLVEDVLARVPEDRLDDVVVLDPTDETRPVGLNPLSGASQEVAADQVLGIFHRLFASSWGPRTSDILHACLLTLARHDQTLVGLPLLLQHAGYRRRLVGSLNDPLGLSSFWGWYESQSEEARAVAVAPVLNKVRAILLRPGLRGILGQTKPPFAMGDVFRRRKVLLVSLARGSLGPETADLFGALVLSVLWQTTLGQARVPVDRRPSVGVVIDEWQNVLHLPTDLGDVLAQARSMGLLVTLANQHLGQLTNDVREAALSNARSKVCFQLTHGDAVTLTKGGTLLKPADFQSLGAFEAYASLMAEGVSTPWASGRSRPAPNTIRRPEQVREASRQRYGRDRTGVDAGLQELIEATAPASRIGRQRAAGGAS